MHVIYIDESGDHNLVKIDPQFPVFCLAGCIINEDIFQRYDRRIDDLKRRYFDSEDVVLHSREIRKREDPFQALMERGVRQRFFNDLNSLITDIPFTIITAIILKERLRKQYTDPANPYMIALTFVIERFLYFLEEIDDTGYVSIESRDPKANSDVLNVFESIMNNGTSDGNSFSVPAERYQNRIQKIEFITKKQNENGHQLADLVAYPIARYTLDPRKRNPAFDVLRPKIRAINGEIEGSGLKIFPQKRRGPSTPSPHLSKLSI